MRTDRSCKERPAGGPNAAAIRKMWDQAGLLEKGIKINIVCSVLYPLLTTKCQPEPLKCTGSLTLQLRDAHLYHIKSFSTNTRGFVERRLKPWLRVGLGFFFFLLLAELCVCLIPPSETFALFVVQVLHTGDVTTMEHGSRPPPTKHGPITTNVQNSSTITTTAMKRWDAPHTQHLRVLFSLPPLHRSG